MTQASSIYASRNSSHLPIACRSARRPIGGRRWGLSAIVGAADVPHALTDWWQRMHSGRGALVAHALRLVSWSSGDSSRYIWEVCEWPQGGEERWCFVCWSGANVGAWWKPFKSKRAAMAFYRQPAEIVMQRRGDPTVKGVFLSDPSNSSCRGIGGGMLGVSRLLTVASAEEQR